ncbi:MAG: hypothetical protein LBB57_04095 [Clostridiales Family XIII bacterium]|jgi:hypothetical protein|nr:hypothetical protein [Clostridiales Family XIII bacterium]
MRIDELLQLLEIERFEDFGFFEYYAELVENEQDIPFETLREFFSAVDKKTLAELTEGYFEETLTSVPGDQTEFFTLLDSIGRNMARIAQRATDRGLDLFTEEFLRFRQWYVFDRAVRCENKESRVQSETSVCEALTLSRLERLGDPDYFFDFDDCMAYPLDASVYPIDELADLEYST